ncbi:hypothetical protein [Algoriphagus marinus]|uniref:hypothetical protein n=1 Tax=Algoriphagus marinus TaxID=1925762 RepID=UPI0011153D5D|nr:hypothetical protein [Algoriphagus marinus]
MTTKILVTCECGHNGYIILRENDTPYSSDFWEYYKLENLNGDSYQTKSSTGWSEILHQMKPSCPKCGSQLNESNLKSRF